MATVVLYYKHGKGLSDVCNWSPLKCACKEGWHIIKILSTYPS